MTTQISKSKSKTMKPQALCLLLSTATTVLAGDLEILSLARNGQLTWTNSVSNGLYTVEWAPRLPSSWKADWGGLQGLAVTARRLRRTCRCSTE